MREALKVYGLAILLIVVAFVVALRFVAPPPPKQLRVATGAVGGYYHALGPRYRELLAEDGIDLILIETQGSLDNLRRLAEGTVDVAFVQGGLAGSVDTTQVAALGGLFFEPVWVLVRSDVRAERLADLRGRRIAVGAEGSGTRVLADQLLQLNGIERSATTVDLAGTAALDALTQGSVDAAIIVIAEPSDPMRTLLASGRVRLLAFDQADAYTMRLPHLTAVHLPMGAINLADNLPARDLMLIAPTAALVAREDLHPALVTLLLNAARTVHSGRQLFAPAGRFPSSDGIDLSLNDDAKRFFERGPSFLMRYLPFEFAILVERMIVLLIPLVTILIPIIRFAPPAYRWQVQRKIYRWYKQVRKLESEAEAADAGRRKAISDELEQIQTRLSDLKVPVSYAQQLYQLRLHLDFVRARLR